MFELNPDYSKRDCSLPPGCKDLIDVIRLEAKWKTFFDSYWKLIYGVAIKAGLNDAEAQEVVRKPSSLWRNRWRDSNTIRK